MFNEGSEKIVLRGHVPLMREGGRAKGVRPFFYGLPLEEMILSILRFLSDVSIAISGLNGIHLACFVHAIDTIFCFENFQFLLVKDCLQCYHVLS